MSSNCFLCLSFSINSTAPIPIFFIKLSGKNSDEEHQDYILNIIERNLKGD